MRDSDLRVLIVADDPLARAGLAALLGQQELLVIVAQTGLEPGLADALEVYRPDALLVDMAWEPAAAFELLARLQPLDLPVLALLPDEAAAAEASALGVTGLLPRNATPPQLVAALLAISEGLVASDPLLFPALSPPAEPPSSAQAEALTPREREVLQLLARGLPNKTIARQLGISDHTVKFHVNSIMGKLQSQSRTEAVVRATQLGLILL